MPAAVSPGRRAASQADQANQAGVSAVSEDNQERDALLHAVEARDLIEFGMIPVRGEMVGMVLVDLCGMFRFQCVNQFLRFFVSLVYKIWVKIECGPHIFTI